MVKKIVIVLIVLLVLFLIGRNVIGPIEPETNSQVDDANTQPTEASASGELKIEDIQIGSGSAEVKKGDTVKMHYRGTLTDGTKFDSSYDRGEPFETPIGVGNVIAGWDEGVPGMKVGGKRKLTIPPHMGYGSRGYGSAIPPNSTLIFDVELVAIN